MALSRRRLLTGLGAAAAFAGTARVGRAVDEDHVIVHPSDSLVGDLLDPIDAVGGTVRHEFEHFPFVAATIPSETRDSLAEDLGVALIEDDDGIGIPDDWGPTLPDLFDPGGATDCDANPEQQPSWGHERIDAPSVTADGEGVAVGVLDTGIDPDHCSLDVAGGADFTPSFMGGGYEDGHGHGTHVAGIAGALDNEIGVVGVAPAIDLYAVKVLDDSGSGRQSNLVAGIDWCISNEIELISLSLGSDGSSQAVDEAVETATAEGHLIISAAGNQENTGDGNCAEETMTYPATHEDVIAVSAMNPDDTLAEYSSVGDAIDLMAPGTDITSTFLDNEYAEASGTSMACPFVTGVAALCWADENDDGPGPNEQVRERLFDAASPVLDTCEEGRGLVDPVAALGSENGTGNGVPDSDDSDETSGELPGRVQDELPKPLRDAPRWSVPAAVAGAAGLGYAIKRGLGRSDQE